MMFEPLSDSFGPVRHETGGNFSILQYQADQIQALAAFIYQVEL